MSKQKPVDLTSLAANWPSSFVARCSIGEFTGGGLSPKRMANLDSSGQGPEGAIRCGRKVLYPVENLVAWMERRCQPKIPPSPRKKAPPG